MLSEHSITLAPSTYWLYRSRHLGPTPAELEQAYLADVLFGLWKANRYLYGALETVARRCPGRDQCRP